MGGQLEIDFGLRLVAAAPVDQAAEVEGLGVIGKELEGGVEVGEGGVKVTDLEVDVSPGRVAVAEEAVQVGNVRGAVGGGAGAGLSSMGWTGVAVDIELTPGLGWFDVVP